MERVIREKTDVMDAMSRPDLGSISFIWGEAGDPAQDFGGGYGVAHIIAKRTAEGLPGEEIARHMVETIARGQIAERQEAELGSRVILRFSDYAAVLSLYHLGQRKTWLLTGWREVD